MSVWKGFFISFSANINSPQLRIRPQWICEELLRTQVLCSSIQKSRVANEYRKRQNHCLWFLLLSSAHLGWSFGGRDGEWMWKFPIHYDTEYFSVVLDGWITPFMFFLLLLLLSTPSCRCRSISCELVSRLSPAGALSPPQSQSVTPVESYHTSIQFHSLLFFSSSMESILDIGTEPHTHVSPVLIVMTTALCWTGLVWTGTTWTWTLRCALNFINLIFLSVPFVPLR